MHPKDSNSYYHLTSHIYVTQFKDELILLDIKKDKYMICFPEVAYTLERTLIGFNDTNYSKSHESKLNIRDKTRRRTTSEEYALLENEYDISSTIQNLIRDNILRESDTPFSYYIDLKPNSNGMSNVDWGLPIHSKPAKLDLEVLSALLTLIKVNFYIRVRGFYSTIQLITRSCKRGKKYTTPNLAELENLANIVNKACLIYPTRTKCLEWAITFVLLALKRGWKCNLEIGVQNYPFMAHAWVECNGKVVMDDQDLRNHMGVILNEPFRRLMEEEA
jgi:hypothetical protein